jgi:predicted metalloprotease with PDZ domain
LPGLAVLLLAAACLLPGTVAAQSAVRHTVSLPDHKEQLIRVRSEFPAGAAETDLVMPNWTPGSYRIREFAANINTLSVTAGDGRELAARKVSKDRWRVAAKGVEALVVDYEVFTPDLNVSTSWASREFTLINGASVFLYTEASMALPQLLVVEAGGERGEAFSALPGDNGAFRAEDYDELVDNPVVVASAPTFRFDHDGHEYVLLNVGHDNAWDGQRAAGDLRKIVAEMQSFWDINPLERPFWFMNLAVGGRGGLEHDHSTVIISNRRAMRDRDGYVRWLGVVAHEFFHVWNVRRMRPTPLGAYDYQNEQYTRQLWLAEGLTSYYDSLLLSRARLITPEEYLELLARDIHRLESTPGRLVRPVTEASMDTWIRHYRPNANSVNSTISYYTKGAVIGFVLDSYIRRESKGRSSLDEVMREMYRRYASEPYPPEAFAGLVEGVGGAGAAALLERLLNETADPDVDDALDWYGLSVERDANGNDAAPSSGFGILWEEGRPGMVVKAVRSDGSGALAGLVQGDEVLAIGGERLRRDNFDELLKTFSPGEQTTLLISRRGEISSLKLTLDTAKPDRYDIQVQPGFGKRHLRRLQSLLGQTIGE